MTDETKASQSGFEPMASDQPASPHKPRCHLVGTHGNVFSIIGRVRRALEHDAQPDQAREFVKRALQSDSYDAVLRLCFEYVEIE